VKVKVLFVWAENAGKSQMAEDFANKDEKIVSLYQPLAINPLKGVSLRLFNRRKKISISNELSKTAEFSNSAKADLIVAM
jgi:protein-tyrosine-phosphatase